MDPSHIQVSSPNLSAEDFAKHIKETHALAQANLVKAADDMKRFHDRHAGEEMVYEAGAKVFLDGRNIKTNRPSAKMEDKWFGPYEVIEKVGAGAYRLKIPKTWRQVHPVFNVSMLKPAHEPVFDSQRKPPPPPPVIVEDEEEYKVDEILDSRVHRGKLQFLVKWTGYDDASWQPESDVENAKEAVTEFYRLHPGAPRKANIPSRHLRPLFNLTAPDNPRLDRDDQS